MKENVMKIKKYKMLILSIILLIGTILLVWYTNEINTLLPILVYILILLIAAAFYYTVKLIKKGKYLNLFNIGILTMAIIVLIIPFCFPIVKVKAKIEFSKYEKQKNQLLAKTKRENYKECKDGICKIKTSIEKGKNYEVYRNDIEGQLIEFTIISRKLSLIYSTVGENEIKELFPVDDITLYKDNWYFVTKKD